MNYVEWVCDSNLKLSFFRQKDSHEWTTPQQQTLGTNLSLMLQTLGTNLSLGHSAKSVHGVCARPAHSCLPWRDHRWSNGGWPRLSLRDCRPHDGDSAKENESSVRLNVTGLTAKRGCGPPKRNAATCAYTQPYIASISSVPLRAPGCNWNAPKMLQDAL